jgi:hypothetical protein
MEAAMTDPASTAGPGGLPADHPVNRQLDAYNAHRLDEFVACFAPTIRLTTGNGTVRAEGHEQLRTVYVPVFAIVGRRATIVNRIAVGDWVVDHERIDDDSGRQFEAAVAFHLTDRQIDEMRMLD